MKALARVGIVDAKCTVTFNKRLSLDELDEFLQRNEIGRVDGIELRFTDEEGERTTSIIPYAERTEINAQIEDILSSYEQELEYKGVIDALVRVSPRQVEKIAADEAVHCAEWTAYVSATSKYGAYPQSNAWELEEKGLVE